MPCHYLRYLSAVLVVLPVSFALTPFFLASALSIAYTLPMSDPGIAYHLTPARAPPLPSHFDSHPP